MKAAPSELLSPQTDDDLVLLDRFVRGGDEEAFGSLVGRYQQVVLAAAYRRSGDLELARDVAQQVFIVLARKAERLRSHQRLGGWLYRAASQQAARAVQSEGRRRKREAQAAVDAESLVEAFDQSVHWDELEEAMMALSDERRDLIVMRYFQDLHYSEIADQLGLSEVATRKRISRALEDLGRRLLRRGVASSAAVVLVGAAAAQAALPVQGDLAMQCLAGSLGSGTAITSSITATATATASTSLWSSIMTTTSIKSAAAVTILAALPLGMQWIDAREAVEELGQLESVEVPATAIALGQTRLSSSGASSSNRDLGSQLLDAQVRLEKLRRALEKEEADNRKRQAFIEKVDSEYVISIGTVDKIADALARMVEMSAQDEDGPEVMNELMALIPVIMPAVAELPNLDQNPTLFSRFTATMIARIAELPDDQRDRIQAGLLPEMQKMVDEGLVYANRPEDNSEEWEQRFEDRSLQVMKSVEPLLPTTFRESEEWSQLIDGSIAADLSVIEEEFGGLEDLLQAEPDEDPGVNTPQSQSYP